MTVPPALAAARAPRFGWLDGGVLAVTALTAGLVAADSPAPAALGLLGATLAVFLAAWAAVGRRAVLPARRGLPMIVVLLATCAIGTAVDPAFATFQLIAFPLGWLLVESTIAGVATSIAVTVAVGVPYAVHLGPLASGLVGAISLGLSLAMGLWISRIEQRSADRQRLVDELTAAQRRIEALGREAGTATERERLARELHDTLTQTLTGIVMLAERAAADRPADPVLPVLTDAARQALAEARALVTASAPVPLEGGLPAALATLAARFRRETGLSVEVVADVQVPRGLEVVLLRCAQEALANVRKHSGASLVRLRVVADGADARLTVTDDGRGPGAGDGYGIAGMRDRLSLVDGEVALSAAPGGGSVLAVRVPVGQDPGS